MDRPRSPARSFAPSLVSSGESHPSGRVARLVRSPASTLAAGILVFYGAAAVVACSGSGSDVFVPAAPDAGPPPASIDASLVDDAPTLLADGGQIPCPPAPVTSFTPAWKPPVAFKSGACTSAQMSGFFDACLGASSSTGGCTTFVQSNTACAACLQSDETDSEYGPIVWHSNRTYYTTNIAGCIADEQADAGAAGCGAAYQAVIQCKETACSACLSAQNPSFSRFATCEGQAGTECASYSQTLESACGTALVDAASPVVVCIPPSGDTAEDAYLRLAPIFCGQ